MEEERKLRYWEEPPQKPLSILEKLWYGKNYERPSVFASKKIKEKSDEKILEPIVYGIIAFVVYYFISPYQWGKFEVGLLMGIIFFFIDYFVENIAKKE